MNRDDQIRARFDAYTDAINDPSVDSEPYWAVFRDNAYADIEDLLAETARLRAELELEKQCFDSQGYEYNKLTADLAAAKEAYEGVQQEMDKEHDEYMKLVETYKDLADTFQADLAAMTAENEHIYDTMTGMDGDISWLHGEVSVLNDEIAKQHDALAAMTAERDAAKQDVTYLISLHQLCGYCGRSGNDDHCKRNEYGRCEAEWRGPVAGNRVESVKED